VTDALREDDAELAKQATHLIGLSGARFHIGGPRAVQREYRLLFRAAMSLPSSSSSSTRICALIRGLNFGEQVTPQLPSAQRGIQVVIPGM
jgi:hypothetical protein